MGIVTQLCPTLCDRPHVLYSPWNSPGQNTGVGSLSLLQGIFPTQGSNPGLPHCRRIFYQLNHKRSPLGKKKKKSPGAHIKDDAVKELHCLYQQIWKKFSSVHITGKGHFSFQSQRKAIPKNYYCTITLISHTSKIMLKILQMRLQHYVK